MPGYDEKTLLKVAEDRGYLSRRSVVDALTVILGRGKITVRNKVSGKANFSLPEICVVGAFFEMTPREFCDTFLHDLFHEDGSGRYTAFVGDPGKFLHQKEEEQKALRLKKKRDELEKMLQKINEDISDGEMQ